MEVVLGEEESLRWEGFVKRIGFMPGVKEWELNGGLSQLHSADNEAIAWMTDCRSRRSKTANIKILSANSKHRR